VSISVENFPPVSVQKFPHDLAHDLAINIEQENTGAITVLFTHYGEGKEENQK
jgi:hypothetical protein